MKVRSKQKGFSVVAVLLVIIAVSGVGFVGWRVMQSNGNKDAQKAPSVSKGSDEGRQTEMPKSKQSVESQKSTNNDFAVPELSVKFTIPESLSDLRYHIVDQERSNGDVVKFVYFSTKSLTDVAPDCAADKVSIAAMGWNEGGYPDDPELRYFYGPLLKQFPASFVTYTNSKADCTNNNATALKLMDAAQRTLSESVKTVRLTD
jgi:hypothetical protein